MCYTSIIIDERRCTMDEQILAEARRECCGDGCC
jgi:hypothetical protein